MINPKKLLVKNLIMLVFFVVFGICCVITGRTSSTYLGFTVGGIAVLLLTTIRTIKMLKNQDFKKQVEIDANDERTKMINAKTSEITTFILLMVCCTGGFVSMFLDKNDYLYIFGGLVILFALVYLITKAILNKKY